MFTRTRTEPVPEVGAEAPEFNLPSAQGGQLRLSMRTVRGPVVIASYRPGDEEDVEYFKALAEKEEEINLAAGSLVGLGVAEPDEAREFVRATGIKSYVLYDYARAASRDWGLLQKDKQRGDYTARAVFVVGPDHKVAHAWTGERPKPEEILAKVSEITGLPKKPAEEKPKRPKEAAEGEKAEEAGTDEGSGAPKKLSAEERERIKAERRAAREAGKSLKTGAAPAPEGEAPKKLTAEERERIKAERRAAREAGRSVKTGASAAQPPQAAEGGERPAKMSAEERERIKAERRAAREAGKSLKQPAARPEQARDAGASAAGSGAGDEDTVAEASEPPGEKTREG
ncbi:MAG: redoxin domain-containing protein [Actinomycetota bacterium]|nr:redoxin domain-containing protein [Actinomycetota bacterium]